MRRWVVVFFSVEEERKCDSEGGERERRRERRDGERGMEGSRFRVGSLRISLLGALRVFVFERSGKDGANNVLFKLFGSASAQQHPPQAQMAGNS